MQLVTPEGTMLLNLNDIVFVDKKHDEISISFRYGGGVSQKFSNTILCDNVFETLRSWLTNKDS